MTLFSSLKTMDQRFSWSFAGFIAAILFGGLAVYTTFFYVKRPAISYDIVSNTRVYDIRENIDSLEIRFENQNIRESKQTLSVLTLKVANPSDIDILKTFFDDSQPLGVVISNSRIIRYEITAANDDYTRSAARVSKIGDDTLTFAPFILESGAFFTLKILLIHSEDYSPHPAAIGKVAGVPRVQLTDSTAAPIKEPFWRKAFSGAFMTQLLRVLAYGIGTIIGIIGIAISLDSFGDSLKRSRRKRLVKNFSAAYDGAVTEKEMAVFEEYIARGEFFIVEVEKSLLNCNRLQISLDRHQRKERHRQQMNRNRMVHGGDEALRYSYLRDDPTQFLLEHEIVRKEGATITVDENTATCVKLFVLFLTANVPAQIKEAKRRFVFEVTNRQRTTPPTLPATRSGSPEGEG